MITLFEFIMLSLLLGCTLLGTWELDRVMKGKGYKVNNTANLLIMTVVTTALILFGGFSAWTVKGIALALILLYASVQDITERKMDDFLWIMILLLCIGNASNLSLLSMLGGAFITFVPTMAFVMLSKSKGIGGADIKMSAACGLCLGFMGGAIGYMIGLLFAVLFNLIYNKVKHRNNKKSFPMLPFLAVGFIIGYFI